MTRFSNCTIATRNNWHARIFATKRTINISKIPPELAGNKLSGYVSISILIKCGEWVVYADGHIFRGRTDQTYSVQVS